MTSINPYAVDLLTQAFARYQAQDARTRQRADIQNFLDTSATIANTFASISQNQIAGAGSLAAQSAINRIRAAAKAKLGQAADLAAKFKIDVKA